MIDEPKQDLLLQYLLNEVDSSTAEKIRAELENDPELQAYVWQMEDAFASMACAVPPMEPPAGLPQRILQIERNNQRGPAPRSRSKIVWMVVPWALAACLAIGCIVLSLERTRLQEKTEQMDRDLVTLQQTNTRIGEELATLEKRNVLAQIRIATLKSQVAAYAAATAVVVWDKDHKRGVLQLDKLPPPAPGKDYQLWVIDPKITQPVSAGVLAVPNDGLIRTSFDTVTPVESAAAFAISVEKAGGSSKPEGLVILVGK
jgi:anti-sigma-K factor RskA